MRPPVQQRFTKEDYQEAPAWFGRFLTPLNQFIEQTVQVFTRNISLGDNIQARTFTTNLQTSASYSTGDFETIKFSWSGTSLPVAVFITAISKSDGTQLLTSVGTPTWRYGDASINVTYVPGLANSTKYSISFLAI